jgi:hypothetical protein
MEMVIMLRRLSIILTSLLFLFGCGGGSGSSDSDDTPNINTSSSATEIIKNLGITLANQTGQVVDGNSPIASTGPSIPIVKSAPDSILTSSGNVERVDILFDTEFRLQEIYIAIDGADAYIRVDNPNTDVVVNNAEVISLLFNISENIESDAFCVEISGMDSQDSVSASIDVCFSIAEDNSDSRVVYFADFSTNSTLATLDFDTGDVKSIGSTGLQLTDIGFLDGQLYGVTFTELVSLDKTTGSSSMVGSMGVSGVNALVGRDGMLYGMSTTGEYFTIDPVTGSASIIKTIGSGAGSSGDLVFNYDGTILWGTVIMPGFNSDQLIKIDTVTNNVEFVGDIGFSAVYGLAYLRGQLLGLTAAGEFIIIDPNSGKGTLVENTDAFSAGGAAVE